jgi:hypothetical protein
MMVPQNNNGGLANNFDKLVGNKTSKNTLVVANARNPYILDNGDLLFMNINSSSSQGPTDDGRIKPDISETVPACTPVQLLPTIHTTRQQVHLWPHQTCLVLYFFSKNTTISSMVFI